MPNIYVISDTHFNHDNILTFQNPNGSYLRNFERVEEMDELIINKWNSVVRPNDKIYHLGDVTMMRNINRMADMDVIMSRLNGQKRLVRGNHDVAPIQWYLKHFDEVYGSRVLDNFVLTHIPLHPESLGRFKANVHGHIHNSPSYGPKYINVSVEAINYTPVSIDELNKKIANES